MQRREDDDLVGYLNWMSEHWVLTIVLVFLVTAVIDNMVVNICKTITKKRER